MYNALSIQHTYTTRVYFTSCAFDTYYKVHSRVFVRKSGGIRAVMRMLRFVNRPVMCTPTNHVPPELIDLEVDFVNKHKDFYNIIYLLVSFANIYFV